MNILSKIRIPEFCMSHWLLRIPLAIIFIQQGLMKIPVDIEEAASYGLSYLVWWFVAYGELLGGLGLIVGWNHNNISDIIWFDAKFLAGDIADLFFCPEIQLVSDRRLCAYPGAFLGVFKISLLTCYFTWAGEFRSTNQNNACCCYRNHGE